MTNNRSWTTLSALLLAALGANAQFWQRFASVNTGPILHQVNTESFLDAAKIDTEPIAINLDKLNSDPRVIDPEPILTSEQTKIIETAIKLSLEQDQKLLPELPKELSWVVNKCTGFEQCEPLREFLVELPLKAKMNLAETMKASGIGSKLGELRLASSESLRRKLVVQIEDLLHTEVPRPEVLGDKVGKIQLKMNDKFVDLDIIGKDIVLEEDILVAKLDWKIEELQQILDKVLNGDLDYWPVDKSGGGSVVGIPYVISDRLSEDKKDDIAMAMARMVLETAEPMPSWWKSSGMWNRSLRQAIVQTFASQLKTGTVSAADISDAVGALCRRFGKSWNVGSSFFLNFYPRDTEESYLDFVPHATRCSSWVGMRVGDLAPNTINVANWCQVGSLMHEMLHALGFYHTQSRRDRDDWVDVLWANIIDDREHNYHKKAWRLGGTPYDYFSVLHYSRINGFSIGGRPTMNADPAPLRAAVPGWIVDLIVAFFNGAMGQREGPSVHDINALRSVYRNL